MIDPRDSGKAGRVGFCGPRKKGLTLRAIDPVNNSLQVDDSDGVFHGGLSWAFKPVGGFGCSLRSRGR